MIINGRFGTIRKNYMEKVKIKEYHNKSRKKQQKTILLPVTSKFGKDDNVILMLLDDYKDLIEKDTSNNVVTGDLAGENHKLNNDNHNLTKENHELKEKLQECYSSIEALKLDNHELKNELSDEKELLNETIDELSKKNNKIINENQLLKKDIKSYENGYKGFYTKLLLEFNIVVNEKLNNTSFINRVLGRFNVLINDNDFEKIENIHDDIKRIR